MSLLVETPAGTRHDPARSLSRIPLSVWLIAIAAALLHAAPFVHAALQAPPGWRFTGILQNSPDFIQYRAWMRQSQLEGPLVTDSLTSEPSGRHLPVLLFWVAGKLGGWFHQEPEIAYEYLGVPLAFGLVLTLFLTAKHFLESRRTAFWATVFMILGGGLGAYIKLILRFPALRDNFLVRNLLKDPFWNSTTLLVFEDYRWHYVSQTLFDTHYLAVWLLTTIAILALWFAIERPGVARVAAACAIYVLLTFLHIHEAIVLSMVSAAMIFVFWRKGFLTRGRFTALAAAPASGMCCLVALFAIQKFSGVPFPPWRAPVIPFALFAISYPAALAIIGCGAPRYWKQAGVKEAFLTGWAAGCAATILSGPFYAFPDRGSATLSIPLAIICASIFFPWFDRVGNRARAAALAGIAFVSLLTPLQVAWRFWEASRFQPSARYMYTTPEQRAIGMTLRRRSSHADVLLARESDVLWLSSEHPGKHYCAHFFLTVDYPRKAREVAAFYSDTPAGQADFLIRSGIRFLFVNAADHPERFMGVSGLTPVYAAGMGTLFRFSASAEHTRAAGRQTLSR